MRPVVRGCLRLAVVLTLAIGASACSTIADLDPTGLLSDDKTADSSTATPDLSTLPNKPDATTTPDDQKQVAASLAADGAQTQYSSDALRAGTEAAAAPPPPASAPVAEAAATPAPPPAAEQTAAATPPPAGDTPAPAETPAAAPSPAPQTAALPPPSGAQPAVPMNSGPRTPITVAMANPTDAQLGFKPSTAAPLDASISDWVPAPIVDRYRQTAEQAGIATNSTAVPVVAIKRTTHGRHVAMGGPDAMSGSVVANMDALNGPASAVTAADGGVTPAAVIYFPGDGTSLSAAARAEIRSAVQAFKAGGGQGVLRVVGHASSRTANMPVEKHLMVIFEKSQSRANAVAQEIIREGVPASKVLVEAVGDSQPVYYESMPKGEDGNRRAEIFLQG